MKELDNRLEIPDIKRVNTVIVRQGKGARIKAYLNAIIRANRESFKEALKMGDVDSSLMEVLEEFGLNVRWEARGLADGKEIKAIEIAKIMVADGEPVEKITRYTGLTHEEVEDLRNSD